MPASLRTARWLHDTLRAMSSAVTSPFVRHFPPGHFYSPLPDPEWVRTHRDSLFKRTVADCPGIDLRVDQQLQVLDELAILCKDLPFPEARSPGYRYFYENPFYSYGDAAILFGMLRRLKPRRVIEVGSGFSSAVMLDTDERFLGGETGFTFIEPHPQRLFGLLTGRDSRCEVLRKPVQEVDLSIFDALESGDILFVDSSHVVKIGSDVRHLLGTVLPRLRAGVVIHFHDVFWPFEYPDAWVFRGHAWNEAYFLQAFLQYNGSFQIEYFNTYIAAMHPEALRERIPLCMRNPGGSLWVRKTVGDAGPA